MIASLHPNSYLLPTSFPVAGNRYSNLMDTIMLNSAERCFSLSYIFSFAFFFCSSFKPVLFFLTFWNSVLYVIYISFFSWSL